MEQNIKVTGPCSLCDGTYNNYGNNPEPILPNARRCCDTCNATKVIPARIGSVFTKGGAKGGSSKSPAKIAASRINGAKNKKNYEPRL